MAWEESSRQGTPVMTGDKPIDEMSIALKKIVSAYVERFGRKPTLGEIIYALEIVIETQPETYLSDPHSLTSQSIF